MSHSDLDKIVDLAQDQFKVKNATDCIEAVQQIEDVFSPPHHGPRNIPIKANNVLIGNNFTHFPIVTPAMYYLFVVEGPKEVEIVDMHYNGPSQQLNDEGNRYLPIELKKIPKSDLKKPFKQGYYSESEIVFNQSDPQPIAIHFETKTDKVKELNYIVVGTPTCKD